MWRSRHGVRGVMLPLFAIVVLTPRHLPAQSAADFEELERLEALYAQHERAGQWKQASEVARQNLNFVRQRRFIAELDLAALQKVGLSEYNLGRFREALPFFEAIISRADRVQSSNEDLRILVVKLKGGALVSASNCHTRLGQHAEALPLSKAAVDYFQQRGFALEAASARTGFGWALHKLNSDKESLNEFNRALIVLVPAARQERPPGQAYLTWTNTLLGISSVHETGGRFDLAEPVSRQALNAITRAYGWKDPRSAQIMAGLAYLYSQQGRYGEAEPLFVAAIDTYKATVGIDHADGLSALMNLGSMLRVQGRNEEAEPIIRHVLEAQRAAKDSGLVRTLTNLASLFVSQKKLDEAETLCREALTLAEGQFGPMSAEAAQAVVVLAGIQFNLGGYEQALALCDRGLAIHQQVPVGPGIVGRIWLLRGACLWSLDRKPEAFEAMQNAIEATELQRAYFGGAEREWAAAFGEYSGVYDILLSWHAETSNVAEMFSTIETLKARSFLDELQLGKADLLEGLESAERDRLAEDERDLRQRLTAAEGDYNRLRDLQTDDSPQSIETLRKAAGVVLAARTALYQHLAHVRSASPLYRRLLTRQAQISGLDAAQQELLGPSGLLLSYRIGDEQSYLLIVRRDSARFVELTVDERQAPILGVEPGPLTHQRFAAALLGNERLLAELASPKAKSNPTAKLAALWEVLVPAAERRDLVDGSIEQLTILPDGPLALLPFEVLVTEVEPTVKYLLDVGPPIAYASSASVLMNLTQRPAAANFAAERVLTLGDPAYSRNTVPPDAVTSQLGVRSNRERFSAALSRLPYSGRESRWVADFFARYGVTSVRLTSEEATERKMRELAARRQIVHLACHGIADETYGNFFGCLALAPGNPSDPGDDGFLYTSEICNLPLTECELAILSACQTNYGPHQTGEGVWNLSRAFLVAGARRVVASNWVVDDEAGATLVSYYAAYLAVAGSNAEDCDYAKALQQAKQQVRKEARWSHPFYWSSLVLVGPK